MATRKKGAQEDLCDGSSAKHESKPLVVDAARLRENWLAPAGSAKERQALKKLFRQKGLSDEERALILGWLEKPNGFEKWNDGFWWTAKKLVLGNFAHSTAMERHEKLSGNEWIVACLVAHGKREPEIAKLIGKSERTVDYVVGDIKDKIMQDLDCDVSSVNLTEIALWFLGL